MKKCCGKCEFSKKGKDEAGNTEFCCTNEDSEMYGIPTDYCDWCGEFVEKE